MLFGPQCNLSVAISRTNLFMFCKLIYILVIVYMMRFVLLKALPLIW